MSTRLLMIVSAALLVVAGLVASFVPREILIFLGARPDPLMVVFVQLTGALYLGFAMLNWMAREGLMGGIYGRPVVFANFTHFMIAALALVKALIAGPRPMALVVATFLYAVLCLAFLWVSFTPPSAVAPGTTV